MRSDIAAWLESLGLSKYQEVFAENDIDIDVLAELNDIDLKDLGLSLGDRKRLLKAIATEDFPSTSAPRVATDIATAPAPAARSSSTSVAERRQLTVMFVDLVGSTGLSAQLDPEDLRELILTYQNVVAGEITRFEGFIARYMGDGVLAYFGWPRAHEDEAERAIRAGLAVAAAVAKLSAPDGMPLAARIGIATGLVVVGDLIGEGASQEQAVVGETPNLAARLQGLAESGAVVIAPHTQRLCGELFELIDLGPHQIKGFNEPLKIWQVVGENRIESRFDALRANKLMPLVGREHELGLLSERWELAKRGEGQTVLLSGEPGIGKSRLTQALLEKIATEPHIRLRFYCSPYRTQSALYPVIGEIERTAGFSAEDDTEVKLERLEALLRGSNLLNPERMSLLAMLLSVPTESRYPPLSLTPQAQRAKTFELLLSRLEELAIEQPVLMVFEDAHWIDPTSIEFFDQVIERLIKLPVLLLITYRPEFIPPWSSHTHVTQLMLNRLGQRYGMAIIERLSKGKTLPEEVIKQILEKADGIPLFVEELAQTLLESGLLRETDEAFVIDNPLPPLAIPMTLQDSLAARLDRFAPVKEVAQIGAVIGREFSYELLASAADMPQERLSEALDQLVSAQLLFRRGAPPQATYTFKHALIQDAAYQGLLISQRQQLHARIAQVMEKNYPQRAETESELVAHHYTLGGLAELAVTYWVRAAQRASNRSENREALSHADNGLKLLDTLPDNAANAQAKAELYYARGLANRDLQGFNSLDTMQAFSQAQSLYEQVGEDPTKLISTLRGMYNHYFTRGHHRKCQEFAEQILVMARKTQNPVHFSEAYPVIGSNLFHRGKPLEARKFYEDALSHYIDSEQTNYVLDPKTAALMNLSWVLWVLGYPQQAIRTTNDTIKFSRQLLQPFSLSAALVWVTSVSICCGQLADAARLNNELTDLITKHQLGAWTHRATFLEGKLAVEEKTDKATALSMIRQTLDTSLSKGTTLHWTWMTAEAVDVYLDLGEIDESTKLLRKAFEFVEKNDERFWESELHRLKGKVLLSQPESDQTEAENCFLNALEIARNQGAKSLELRAATSLAQLWGNQGNTRKAYDLLASVYHWFAEGFDTTDLKNAKALLDEIA